MGWTLAGAARLNARGLRIRSLADRIRCGVEPNIDGPKAVNVDLWLVSETVHTAFKFCVKYSAPVREQSVVMSVSVCLSVCLSVSLYLELRNTSSVKIARC